MMRGILTGLIKSCDMIYGKQVTAQCQSQININKWKGKALYNIYITKYLKKDINFFLIYSNLTSNVICIIEKPTNEDLDKKVSEKIGIEKYSTIKGKRVIVWSRDDKFKVTFRSKEGTGHNKQGGTFKDYTFCVKDIGISWKR